MSRLPDLLLIYRIFKDILILELPNDFSEILAASKIARIFCTGKTAFNLYKKHCSQKYSTPFSYLPSTSPANQAAWPTEKLTEEYRKEILRFAYCTISSFDLNLLMETKLILSDLDETLLRSDKTISDYSARIFEKCRQRGILVGFCTSRGKPNIIPFENKINPDICICNGGASIYHNGSLLHASSFNIEETNSILERARTVCGSDCEITVDTIDKIFWNRKKDKSTDYADNSIYDDFLNFTLPAMKICVQTGDSEKAQEIARSVSSCDFLPFSDIPWYKFSPASATKENAISILCKKLNISPKEILAFGDDFNDIGMLKLCGKGIAMGNAIAQVKEVSDGMTKTNNEDGVAWYLENFILKD